MSSEICWSKRTDFQSWVDLRQSAFDVCPLKKHSARVMAFADVFLDLLKRPTPLMRRFLQLISEETGGPLEALARHSQQTTRRHFGQTMRLFAPLYVSNECVNNCQYCGFSRDAGIFRTTLTVDQVVTEARHLHGLGFRNVLLVAGEHPKFVSDGYLQNCLDALKPFIKEYSGVGTLNQMKKAAEVYRGAEKEGVHAVIVANPNVVDTEIAFGREEEAKTDTDLALSAKAKGPSPRRIDLACFEKEGNSIRLRFWEAKLYKNPEIVAKGESVAQIIDQVTK